MNYDAGHPDVAEYTQAGQPVILPYEVWLATAQSRNEPRSTTAKWQNELWSSRSHCCRRAGTSEWLVAATETTFSRPARPDPPIDLHTDVSACPLQAKPCQSLAKAAITTASLS